MLCVSIFCLEHSVLIGEIYGASVHMCKECKDKIEAPTPVNLGETDLQKLNDAELNPFAATLLVQSYGKTGRRDFTLESVRFLLRSKNGKLVEVTLRDLTCKCGHDRHEGACGEGVCEHVVGSR
jgi:hypothetical protein